MDVLKKYPNHTYTLNQGEKEHKRNQIGTFRTSHLDGKKRDLDRLLLCRDEMNRWIKPISRRCCADEWHRGHDETPGPLRVFKNTCVTKSAKQDWSGLPPRLKERQTMAARGEMSRWYLGRLGFLWRSRDFELQCIGQGWRKGQQRPRDSGY